eukprot:CAMPEP_0184058006 /NCGR_PEP_ID=MMETSP0956-20121227/8919_1 /TAXON_ID=627963 /ORGANISM="Aplanochytrium sp, Strain PBS07" /LENGTH=102 /DNA_ID=CAMNT_0026352747 /DNA_START=327 /DNA_END=632 /DNA_ORIENTATION=+
MSNLSVTGGNELEKTCSEAEKQITSTVDRLFVATGLDESLDEHLRRSLASSGWRKKIRDILREALEKNEKATVEELIAQVSSEGFASVPTSLKDDIYNKLDK